MDTSHQKEFGFTKRFISGRHTFTLYPIICTLSLSLLLDIIAPPSAVLGGWAATYGGTKFERPFSIQQTSDEGYIVTGWTDSFGTERDIWVLKLKPDGTVEWQKTYGGDDSDEARSIQQTKDGGYIVAGATSSFVPRLDDLWVLKLKADGAIEWQKIYGGDDSDGASSIQQTSDGGYIVAGETSSFGAGETDFWVLKLRPDGSIEWERTYGGDRWDVLSSIRQTRDGGYIVAGYTGSFVPGGQETPDLWVLKLRPNGTVEWENIYGRDDWDSADSIQQTSDGGYIAAGETRSFGTADEDIMDFWVLKLKPDGTIEWQKTYGGVHWDFARCIQQTNDGGYIVAGEIEFSGRGNDAWVLKLRHDGTVEWQKTYGGDKSEGAHYIQQTRDGGYIVAGETESFGAGGVDFWILKLEPDGSIDPSCNFIKDTSISEKEGSASVRATRSLRDSNASPRNSSATVRDTNVSADMLYPSTAIE